jgi:hypothetical protein
VTAGTSLQIDAATASIVYQTSDATGAADSVLVDLHGTAVLAANGGGTAGFTTTSLTLEDSAAAGIGDVTINSDASVYQGLHTITTLTDTKLSNLAVTGSGSLSITNAATAATSLAISDNGTGTSVTDDGIVNLTSTGDVLATISSSGTHAFTIGTLTDSVASATITNANTGSAGVLTIGAWTDNALTSLTLSGSVKIGSLADSVAGAVTISGATDHQDVNVTLSGNGVDTVSLGDGANVVVTGSSADVITLGTGANTITAGAGADAVTFGTHAGVDTIIQAATGNSGAFATPGANSIATASFDVVSGMHAGDVINLSAMYTGNGLTAATTGDLSTASATVATTLVGLGTTDNAVYLVRGTYDATAHTFVGSSAGHDTLLVYDGNAAAATTAQEAVVLVGYAATSGAGVNHADGTIHLA